MNVNAEVVKIVNRISDHDSGCRHHDARREWTILDKERAACYFVAVHDDFDALKRVIHALSGSFILARSGVKIANDVTQTLGMAKNLFSETVERAYMMMVPKGLEGYHAYFLACLKCLDIVFQQDIEKTLPYLNKQQMEVIFSRIKQAYENLKKASSFNFGLVMVSLESSCACGLH